MADAIALTVLREQAASTRKRARWSVSGAATVLSAYLLLVANGAFWKALLRVLTPVSWSDVPLLIGVAAILLSVLWLLLGLLAWRVFAKPLWIALIALAAAAAYFMDSYGLLIDRAAIQSVFETDPREASEWLSLRMLPYLGMVALPAWWLVRIELRQSSLAREAAWRLSGLALACAVIAAGAFLHYQRLSSIARNHRELPHLINPTTVLQSTWGYAKRRIAPRPTRLQPVGTDATLGPSWTASAKPRVLVLVVGESARAASFGLLGYARDTTPQLRAEADLDYATVRSCGTSTAVSLPCMFSDLGHAHYSDRAARSRENLLDVIGHAGLQTRWIDNNTGSKQIAARSGEEFLADDSDPRYCDASGCHDEILVAHLSSLLDAGTPPALVVLHQKGSHGPSYFERYPPAFRRFTPTCESNELDDCTREQIRNTYDNTLLYTDHVLAQTIDVLREHSSRIDGAMLYVSDHGESTGEAGMYLHGAPAFFAPDEQTQVPMIAWFSPGYANRTAIGDGCLRRRDDEAMLTHDALFHSVLGLLDIRTRSYRRETDAFAGCAAAAHASAG